MIDLHSHILPGLDDGPRTLEESLGVARAAVEDGITVLAATPHVRSDYPTTADEMERGVALLQEALRNEGIPLELRTGGELALDQLPGLDAAELRRFTLGGAGGRYLLLEFPYYGWPLGFAQQAFQLRLQGYVPIVAHPERSAEVQESPERARQLVDAGALVQLTAASVDGRLGRAPRAAALRLLELGLAHLLASDAHSPALRGVGMTDAAAAVGDERLARWLTEEVPAAVLAGEPPPGRPEGVARPRRRFPFRR